MTTPPDITLPRLLALEAAVLETLGGDDPRLISVMTALIRHAHAFVRDTRPTEDEWSAALDFLVRVGRMSNDTRNECRLLSDMLGLSTAVDEVNFPGTAGATPSSVEGPFHAVAPRRANGDWIATGPERTRGDRMVFRGRVTDVAEKNLSGAVVDVWQADDAGLYDSQDSRQSPGNLRGVFTTDEQGAFWFRTVVPCSYPVPTDGPAGELLRALGRSPMRPAHVHLQISAPGYRSVTTHAYIAGDRYLTTDAAFAVKDELVAVPTPVNDPAIARMWQIEPPFVDVPFHVRLVAGRGTRAPG